MPVLFSQSSSFKTIMIFRALTVTPRRSSLKIQHMAAPIQCCPGLCRQSQKEVQEGCAPWAPAHATKLGVRGSWWSEPQCLSPGRGLQHMRGRTGPQLGETQATELHKSGVIAPGESQISETGWGGGAVREGTAECRREKWDYQEQLQARKHDT